MSGQWIVTLVPPARPAPRAAAWSGRAAAWLLMSLGADSGQRRARDLRRLAREVEGEQPELARELRGIAMHEASLQARLPKKSDPVWLRAARAVAGKLAAVRERVRTAWQRSPRDAARVAETRAAATAREAAEVRCMAHLFDKSDPGFAADLYAAADRHERASLAE